MDFSRFSNIIDGQLRGAETTYHGINPATEENLYEVPSATEANVNDTVSSAQKAFPVWSQKSFDERCDLLRKYAEAFLEQEDGLMELLMKETGKPVGLVWAGRGGKTLIMAFICRDVANRENYSSYEGMIEADKMLDRPRLFLSLIIESAKWTLPVETSNDQNKTATVRYVPLGKKFPISSGNSIDHVS